MRIFNVSKIAMNPIKMKIPILFLSLIALCVSCKNDDDHKPGYVIGKNIYSMDVDGDMREYYVSVPAGYSETKATPVVFMLHGTSGDGEKFYNTSGWKEVGETDTVITVFPSSWHYCIFDEDSLQKNTTKWNTLPANWTLCNGQVARDDIKFLRTIVDKMHDILNIDHKRIYLVGFSNGGQMAAKCAIEMGDIFAAIVENAGSFSFDTTYFPVRKMPVALQRGNEDYGPGGSGPAIPLSALDTLLRTPGLPFAGSYYRVASTHVKSFELDPNFTVSGDTNSIVVATYPSLTADPQNIFQFILVKGLKHAYPNGENHPLEAAVYHWDWLKQYSLP